MHSVYSQTPFIYIVLLNWNGLSDTIECLHSCHRLNYPNFRIIVVDNASANNEADELSRLFPSVSFIKQKTNLGYAGGNNAGIKSALEKNADGVWLLNNDTVVAPDSLACLVDELFIAKNIGCAGSKVYLYDKPETLWFAGGTANLTTGIAGHLGEGEPDTCQYDTAKDVDYLTGCSLLIKKEIFEQIGFLDEAYFLLFEDTDFCARVHQGGYETRYVPSSHVWHKVSQSIAKRAYQYEYYIARNSLYFVSKNGGNIWVALQARLRAILYDLMHERDIFRTYARFKGVLHYFLKRQGPVPR